MWRYLITGWFNQLLNNIQQDANSDMNALLEREGTIQEYLNMLIRHDILYKMVGEKEYT
jgi:hypothetical protein